MKKLLFFLNILTTLFIVSCKQVNRAVESCNENFVTDDNVTVLNKRALIYLEQTIELNQSNKHCLVFNSKIPSKYLPKAGTIFVVPKTNRNAHIFVGKVININKNKNVEIFTENAPLDKAYKAYKTACIIN